MTKTKNKNDNDNNKNDNDKNKYLNLSNNQSKRMSKTPKQNRQNDQANQQQ